MEKINDEQLKKALPFDLYGRYAIMRDVINNNRKKDQRFRVLDVGGRGNLLKKFLPNDDVFYLDPLIDSEDKNFIVGDGCAIPLEDNNFDWITSADVFEHIPKEKRAVFLQENIRVSRLGVILAAPFWSKEVKKAEINANENYKNFSQGEDHMWLKEHLANGLPKEKETEDFLKEKGISFQKLHNNRLFLWETIIGINFFVWNNFTEKMKKELEEFNYFYNTDVFPYDSMEPSYRKIYFIKKDGLLKNLEVKKRFIDDSLFLDVIKRGIDLLAKADTENKKNIKIKDQSIQSKEQEIQSKEQEIQSKEQEIQSKEQEIQTKNQIIQQKEQEVLFIKSSKFWKLRELNFRIKFAIFHPLAFLKKYLKKFGALYYEAQNSLKGEGFSRFLKRTINYIFYGKGVLDKKEIIERQKKSENNMGDEIVKKDDYFVKPIKTVYYISNIPSGGANKYITDLIDAFETPHLNFVQIKNKNDLKIYKNSFKKDDVLLFQYLFFSDLTFDDIVNIKNKSGIQLVIPIHDFYFLQKNQADFYQCHMGVYSNFDNKEPLSPPVLTLLKLSDLIIYPSNFVKNIFDSIFVFKNAKLSKHIDYKICDFLKIPKIEKTINIGIINNITVYKGADYYPKLFSIKKYEGLNVKFHIFGMDKPAPATNVIYHGPYQEDEIFSLLKKNNIHGLVFLNKWGETYSYSLTKGINSGLPILYSNLGAYIERLENNQKYSPIHDSKNIKVDMQKMLALIIQKNGATSTGDVSKLEKDIPDLYRNLFSIDYDTILNKQFNKNRSQYEKLFEIVEPYAIYFPQFHALKENSKTFYEGYHDMINLEQTKKSDSLIETPLKNYLGYYNLKDDDGIIEKQTLLAKANGFKGFGIYYYWFSHNSVTGNNMLMKEVTDKFFQKDLDNFDVFFIYANESWSNNPAFNQHTNEYIIKNEYSEKETIKNFNNLLGYFKHKNYKKVDNKPVLFLHHPWEMTLEELSLFYSIGDRIAKENGFAGLELIVNGMQNNIEGYKNYSHHPNYKSFSEFTTIENGLRYIDYRKYVDDYLQKVPFQSRNIQTAFYNFDNSVRYFNHKNKDILVTKTKNNNIEYFKKFLNFQLDTYKSPEKDGKIFLLDSWNEWGEQMAIEPSSESGFKLLDVFNEVFLDYAKKKENNPKKIIYVGHDAGFFGAQLLSLYIIKELHERFKFDVHFILKSGGPLEEKYKNYAKVYNLAESYRTEEKKQALIKNLKLCGANQAVVNTVVCGDILGMLHDEGIKTLSLVHELPELIRLYGIEKNAKIIAEKADHIIFPSNFVKEKFSEITSFFSDKASIRPQGLIRENVFKNNIENARRELRDKLNLKKDTFVVLGVGCGDERKGVDLFVNIAQRLSKHNIHFVWVGDLVPEMQKRIKPFSLKNITLLKSLPEISLYYAGADVYLMTSREDPFPSVVIESMSVGVPVIGFQNAGGFVDIVTKKTGILVPYLDINAMSEAIKLLEKNADLRKKLGEASKKLIDRDFIFKDYVYYLLETLGANYKKVSAIVPNYNYAKYLPERLDSIISQTYPLYEIIALDDASKDESVQILDDYISIAPFKDFKKIVNKENSGSVFRQWGKGIQESSGDFLWIAEADDLSLPNFLEHTIEGFKDDSVVLSYSQSKVIDENGKKIADNYLEYTNDIDNQKWKNNYIRSGKEEIADSLVIKNTIPNVSAVVFKKVNIESILGKLTEFFVAGDWFFYVWLLQYGGISYTAKSLNIHRRHTKSVTTSLNAKKHFEEIVFMQDHITNSTKIEKQTFNKVIVYREKVKKHLLG